MKSEGLVFNDTARAIRLINSLLMAKTKIFLTLIDNFGQFSEKIFVTKLVQNHFPKVFC